MIRIAFLLLALGATAGPIIVVKCVDAVATEPWLDTDYQRRAKITFLASQVGTTMTTAVVLIDLADLAATYHANVQADADDTRASAADKTSALHVDLEDYDAGADTGSLWVYVGTISSSVNTDIFIYYDHASGGAYGSPQDVWDATGASYMGVYHMGSTATSAQPSATGVAAIDADAYNFESGDLIAGKIGDCIDFDGSNEYYSVPASDATTNLRPDTTFTAMCYFKADDFSDGVIFQGSGNSTSAGYGAWIWSSNLRPSLGNGGNVWTSGTYATASLSTSNWYHYAFTWDGSNARIYLDGVAIANSPQTETGSWSWSSQPFFLGRRESAGYYHGKLDEVRVIDRTMTANEIAWIEQNLNDPSTTYTVAAEETQ